MNTKFLLPSLIIGAMALTSFLLFARADVLGAAPEYVGSGPCDLWRIDSMADSQYTVDHGAVTATIPLMRDFEDEPWHSFFQTNVISSLKLVLASTGGTEYDELIHSSGVVCAIYKKPGLIGVKSWADTGHCRFSTEDSETSACVRNYVMSVQ